MEKLERIIEWTKLKIRIELSLNRNVYFHEREIWWVNLGANVGFEQDGKNKNFERPVLILRKFGPNIFWGLPLSSKEKGGRFYYSISYKNKNYSILLTQLKGISNKRLIRKLRRISKSQFKEVRNKIKDLL